MHKDLNFGKTAYVNYPNILLVNKKQRIIIGIVAILLFSGVGFLFQQYVASQRQISNLTSQVDDLEDELKDTKDKITNLENENSELESKLSNVQHFDNVGTIGQGFTESATNYTGQVLETTIDGDFEGWDGETIFKMMNGTIWQQSSYDYTYHYAYMPDVIIYRKGGSFYMKVEDVDDEIQVRQIK